MLFENVVKQLCNDKGTSLRLLIIDDLQWVDEASAALIHFAYRSGEMMICCATRVAELESNPHAFRLIRALTREKLIRRLDLGPLSVVENLGLWRICVWLWWLLKRFGMNRSHLTRSWKLLKDCWDALDSETHDGFDPSSWMGAAEPSVLSRPPMRSR